MRFGIGAAGVWALGLLAARSAAAATPVQLVLPPTESEEEWRVPLALAGLEPGGDVVVWFVPVARGWEIRVVDAGGAQRLAEVAVPYDAGTREDVAFLAASLVSDLGTRPREVASAPLPASPARAAPQRRAPPPKAVPPPPPAPLAVAPDAPPAPAPVVEAAAPPPVAPAPPPETAPPALVRVPEPAALLLAIGPAVRFTPGSDPTAAITVLVGGGKRGYGPFAGLGGALSAPASVHTGRDSEEVFVAELEGVVGLRGRGAIAPVGTGELLVAYRSYGSGELRIAKLLVPAVGAGLGVDVALPESLTLRVAAHARYDLWSIHIHEPPADDRELSPLGFLVATGLSFEFPARP